MTGAMDPVQVYNQLHDTYLRYLETSFFFKDPALQSQLRDLLRDASQPPLVRRPILEVAPDYLLGRSVQELISSGLLSAGFRRLEEALPPRLYAHQERGIARAIADRRNLVVATGTGSGKTEIFLVPILDHLLREAEAGSLSSPGVRALLLYPMNALANDQVQRLRGLLAALPQITFGRFTGETKETFAAARQAHLARDEAEPLPNELIARDQMRDAPPHILLTNYAMLEYLLIRPKDSPLFAGGAWRFVVLDEVHTYSGAMGAEIAMLLRRLKDRVVASEPRRLQCFATSATLGKGLEDHPRIARFATDLFGERFDPGDVIEATYHRPEKPPVWGAGTAAGYAALHRCVVTGGDPDDLLAAARSYFPPQGVESAQEGMRWGIQGAAKRFLWCLLRGDRNLQELQAGLAERRIAGLDEAVALAGGPDLLPLALMARPAESAAPLISARYHVLTRAMTGVFVWLDAALRPHLLPRRQRSHITPEGNTVAVFEMATCNRCGEEMLVGVEEDGYLRQPPDVGDEPAKTLSWYALRPVFAAPTLDEDDVVEAEEDLTRVRQAATAELQLCVRCGRVDSAAGMEHAGCDGHSPSPVRIFRLENKPRRSAPRSCPSCGNIFGNVASRLVTGKEAPVAVLATALYQLVPPSPGIAEPGAGRKLLVFSDSRQDAAFFAPFMAQTYARLKQRRFLAQALTGAPEGLDLGEWAQRARKTAEEAGEWKEEVSARSRARDAGRWILREWTAWDRRLSLEGTGVAVFRLRFPSALGLLPELFADPWGLDAGEQRRLLHVLLDTLRLQGVVSFFDESGRFEGIEHTDEPFTPRNKPSFVRGAASVPSKGIHAWAPESGRSNKRLDHLVRMLARRRVHGTGREPLARAALDAVWRAIQHRNGPLSSLFEQVPSHAGETNLLRLRPAWWQVAAAGEHDPVQCDTCGTVTSVAVDGVCPMTRCTGTLRPYPPDRRSENHYFVLFSSMRPIPLQVHEHTAQLQKEVAYTTQQDFVDGKINMLSCTTTFELGVDVGDLHTVLMRNVPPSPGNYVQRAGRAGRRAGVPAVIVTYAQRRTHDLAYFENWPRLLRGSIRPPVLRLTNVKIVRRHVYAEALAEFFRVHPEAFADRVDSVFDPDRNVPEQVLDLLRARPPELGARLRRVVPHDLHQALGLGDWAWVDGPGDSDSFAARLAAAASDVGRDWQTLEAARRRAHDRCAYKQADLCQQQLKTLRTRSLLGKLGTFGLMPKYGFPTEVVELKVRSSSREAAEVELERDMKLALTEFAPENEVVAAGKRWKAAGIVLPVADRKLHEFVYWHCERCHFFAAREQVAVQDQQPPDALCHCEEPVTAKRYVFPEFGFTTGVGRGERVGDARPPARAYAASFYHDDAQTTALEPVPAFPAVAYRPGGTGWIHVINDNHGRDFYICLSCGFAALLHPAFRRGAPPFHEKPWSTEERCTGQLHRLALGHRFRTDVLELAFPPGDTAALLLQEQESLWLSLLYAIVSAACLELEIDERDLGGCLSYAAKGVPTLIIFDTCPDGAGFSLGVMDSLPAVLRRARDVLSCNSCAEDSSCIGCLRSYSNQRDHNKLRRGLALAYLEGILTAH